RVLVASTTARVVLPVGGIVTPLSAGFSAMSLGVGPFAICQRNSPLLMSIAVIRPYGGLTTGKPFRSGRAAPPPEMYGMFEKSGSGRSAATLGCVYEPTYSTLVSGSNEPPSQFAPPVKLGSTSVPLVPSAASASEPGVKIGPLRNTFVPSTASLCSAAVKSMRSSSVKPWRSNAGGFVGNGCVGDVTSPGTSDLPTGRSSIGQTGLPFVRSNV